MARSPGFHAVLSVCIHCEGRILPRDQGVCSRALIVIKLNPHEKSGYFSLKVFMVSEQRSLWVSILNSDYIKVAVNIHLGGQTFYIRDCNI